MVRRVVIGAALALCVGCACSDDEERLSLIAADPDDTLVYYDNDRREVCTPYATEVNGARCFPRFTAIDPLHLRYADDACKTLAVWTELESPYHAYVAYVADDQRLVYSIFKIIEPIESPETVTPHALLNGNKCGPYPIESTWPGYKITTRIHPEEFAPVEM